VDGEGRLLRTIEGVLVTGVLETALGLVCDGCLTSIAEDVPIEWEDVATPSIDTVSGASVQVLAEDFSLR